MSLQEFTTYCMLRSDFVCLTEKGYNLFLFVIQTTSHSAWASPAVPAAQHALWCTISWGSPRAESLPPQPFQYDSPANPKQRKPLNNDKVCSLVMQKTCLNSPLTWWIAPSISERLDTLVMDWMRISRFFWSLWMISIDWLSLSQRGLRA